jgi:serine/threonine protein kinase, bacterial
VLQSLTLARGIEPYPGHTLIGFLGRGALGEVWQAQGPEGKKLALKFLPCDNRLDAAHEIRALQSIRQLRHPNLIGVERIWCWSSYIVVAMELADGSMLDLLEVYQADFGTCIVPEHLCHFLGQAADAIDFLNGRQHVLSDQRVAVRHCDIKPSNLLVLQTQVKVADFSLAVQTTSSMSYHRRAGTLNYAAPEVFQGLLSDRTDQYALAVSYIELRTGCLPFSDTPSTFKSDYTRPEPDLSRLDSWEQPILHRALHPVAQDRWPSCRDMVDQLRQIMPGKEQIPHSQTPSPKQIQMDEVGNPKPHGHPF